MSLLVDAVMLIVFLIIVFFLTKDGLANVLAKINKPTLDFFSAWILEPILSFIAQQLFLIKLFTQGISAGLTGIVNNNPNGYNIGQLFDHLPDNIVTLMNYANINVHELEATYGSATEASADIIADMSSKIAVPCAELVGSILGLIVGFVLISIFTAWVKAKIEADKKPFGKVMDYASGFVVGVALGYAALWIISVVVYTVFQFILAVNINSNVMDIYDTSILLKFIREFDVIGSAKIVWNMIV